jgi:hypothetical protein
MTIERIPHSGAWMISTIAWGRLITRTYYGYTKREAQRRFKQYIKEAK